MRNEMTGGDASKQINLRGLAIGNGWIDPPAQYEGAVDFAEEHNLATLQLKEIRVKLSHCIDTLNKSPVIQHPKCQVVEDLIIRNAKPPGQFVSTRPLI